MLAKSPDDRYQTPGALLTDLRRLGTGSDGGAATVASRCEGRAGRQEELHRRAQTEIASRRGTDELIRSDRDTTILANPSPNDYRIACGQFEKADEALATEHFEYGIPLLLNCCALDPANLRYRQALRKAGESNHAAHPHIKLGTAFADWLLKARTKAAKKSSAFGKVPALRDQAAFLIRGFHGAVRCRPAARNSAC